MQYYDRQGNKIGLSSKLGEGGEGSVFRISGNKYFVAKIYHKAPNPVQAEKLAWMCNNAPEAVRNTSAWPSELLYDRPDGSVVGFKMPSIEGRQVFELYSPRLRQDKFPKANWGFLVRSAKNLARAFKQIHDAGHVIGDINHGNCVVFPDGIIKLIDCDSYSIHARGKIYPCEVGVSTHLPPELQGKSLRGQIRTKQQDNFGLAILIFQLLFLGRHPFSGKGSGASNKSLEDCIREHLFVYGRDAGNRRLQHPPGALDLSAVSADVGNLFEQAFGVGEQRPSASDWIEKLHALEGKLESCNQNPDGHVYFNGLLSCPWCDLEAQTGAFLFPFNFRTGSTGFDITTIDVLLDSLQPALTLAPKPARKLVQSLRLSGVFPPRHLVGVVGLIAIQAIVVGATYQFLSVQVSTALGLVIALVYYLVCGRADTDQRRNAQTKLEILQNEWKALEASWQATNISSEVLNKKKWLKEKVSEYKRLPILLQKRLQDLELNVRTQQLTTYLDQFPIDRASIRGIGPGRIATLQSYGIATAADIDRNILGISGFGPTYTTNLLYWRSTLESSFRFDPTKGVRESDKRAVEQQIALSSVQLEHILKKESSQLVSCVSNNNSHVSQLYKEEQRLSRDLATAHSNRLIHFRQLPIVGLLTIIPLLVPFSLFAVHVANLPPDRRAGPTPPANNANLNRVTDPTSQNQLANVANSANLVSNSNANAAQDTLPELVGLDVGSLSEYEKEIKAKELFDKGVELARSKRNSLAIRYYREAIAIDGVKAEYYHEYGYLLYSTKKYRDSIAALSTADRLGSPREDTKLLLGLSYFAVKNWKETQSALGEYVQRNSGSYTAQFHLGLAYRNDGDIPSSVNAFERAVDAKPNEAKAQYELARTYI